MAQSDGAPTPRGDDPALAQALTEMQSEGTLTEGDGDPAEGASSQPQNASAEAPAADSQGQVSAGQDPAVQTPEGQAPAADDPLAGTEPFVHEFNGEKIALEGVVRVPGEGLLVPEEAVPAFSRVIEERATLDRQNREYAQERATTERLSRWQTVGADGKAQEVTGLDAVAAMRVDYARIEAAYQALASVFRPDAQGNYPRLTELLLPAPNGRGVTINPDALAILTERSDSAEFRAQTQAQDFVRQAYQAPAPTQGPDYAQAAPAFIDAAAKSAGVDPKTLTADDRATLTRQFGRYIRPATENDRRQDPNIRVGLPMLDPEFAALVKHTATLRASSAQQAQAAEKAGKHNAGMDRGRAPVKAPAKPPTPATPQKQSNERQRPDWDGPLSSALAEMDIQR